MLCNEIPRDQEYIYRLKKAIENHYGISVIELTPAKRGYYGETWKVRGNTDYYFLKMDYLSFHQKRFQRSLSVIEYLCENEIHFVGKIVKTQKGALYSIFDTALAGLFDWVDGENVETDHTKHLEYQMLCKIYPLTKPGLGVPMASFSDNAALYFYKLWESLKKTSINNTNDTVLSTLERFREEIAHCASRLSQLAECCREDNRYFYLTHGDAGGNFFIGNGQNYIFDWDEAMYAPLERDAWVMGCYDWARKLFDDTLKENHIPYKLRPERLAFYCYHMYFFYLNEFLMVHPILDKSQRILEYFENGWIKNRIMFADTISSAFCR